jgi:hypothetical protein
VAATASASATTDADRADELRAHGLVPCAVRSEHVDLNAAASTYGLPRSILAQESRRAGRDRRGHEASRGFRESREHRIVAR